jgi:hypothetical protein
MVRESGNLLVMLAKRRANGFTLDKRHDFEEADHFCKFSFLRGT